MTTGTLDTALSTWNSLTELFVVLAGWNSGSVKHETPKRMAVMI